MSNWTTNILKNGTEAQLKALKTLGQSDFNAKTDKLDKKYNTSLFLGDFKNFKNSSLSEVCNDKELKALYTLLDADGDKNISEKEIQVLSSLGQKGSDKKVENSDLKVLFSDAQKYVNDSKATTSSTQTKDKITTKTGKNGTKIVTKVKADGTKIVVKYDKNGKKTSSVKTDANGDKTTTKYEYVNGHLVNSKSKKTRVVDGEKVTVRSSETRYNKDGKKSKTVTKDASGNILSETKYSYAKNGKLDKTLKTKSDGTKVLTEYDTNTGNKTAKIKSTPDGKVASRTDYDAKTGNKKSKTIYDYNNEGQKTGIRNYTYNFKGEVATRERYDANRNLISKSTYLHNDDGSMIRTDRDPKTGEVLGTSEFQYDKSGRQISKTDRDKDGNLKSVSKKEYYSSDIQKSYEKVTYNADGSYSKRTNNYDKNGNLTSITNAKYDKDGQQISSKTEKIEVKETKINDLPKLDYKALEKLFGGDGKGLVDFASKYLGYNEANGSYKKFTGGRTEAWCADFVTYIIKNYAASNGIKLPSGFGSSSVAGLMAWGKANGMFQDTTKMSNSEKSNYAKNNLKPGDIIIWKSNGASHTGIVKSVNEDGTFTTIEGNSSDQVKSNKKSIYDKSLTGFIPCSSIIA